MEEAQKRLLASVLKAVGFESASLKAMELFLEIFDDCLRTFLTVASNKSLHASRPSLSLLDVLDGKQTLQKIIKSHPIDQVYLKECNVSIERCKFKNIEDMFSLIPFEVFPVEYEIPEPELGWNSPLSTKVEKFIHIYDFMPSFPPIHTFRMTFLKSSSAKNQSSKVKNRLEQSLRSEGNMIKLIKSNGSIPGFINYIYKNKTK